MSNLSQRFNNLSLYKKILLILSTTLLFVFFAFVVGIQLLSQYYARELYTSNAQSLNYVSSFVSARMETVESGSARILSDTIIQTNLTDIMDAPTSIRNAQRKQTIYQALYPYIFDDDYIKSISLVLPDDTLICMGNTSDLDAFPLEELAENAAACQGRASWSAPASPGNTIVLYRDIRQLHPGLEAHRHCYDNDRNHRQYLKQSVPDLLSAVQPSHPGLMPRPPTVPSGGTSSSCCTFSLSAHTFLIS